MNAIRFEGRRRRDNAYTGGGRGGRAHRVVHGIVREAERRRLGEGTRKTNTIVKPLTDIRGREEAGGHDNNYDDTA